MRTKPANLPVLNNRTLAKFNALTNEEKLAFFNDFYFIEENDITWQLLIDDFTVVLFESQSGQRRSFFQPRPRYRHPLHPTFQTTRPFLRKYAAGLEQTRKLEPFLEFLKTIDRWNKVEPLESVIGEKDKLIAQLKQRIAELEAQLKQVRESTIAMAIHSVYPGGILIILRGCKLLTAYCKLFFYFPKFLFRGGFCFTGRRSSFWLFLVFYNHGWFAVFVR